MAWVWYGPWRYGGGLFVLYSAPRGFSAVPPAFPLTKTNRIYVSLNSPPCEFLVCSLCRRQTAQNYNFFPFCSWPQQSPTQCHAGWTWFRLHQRKLHWCEWPLVTFYLWSLSQFYSIYILIWFAILVVAFPTKGFLMVSRVYSAKNVLLLSWKSEVRSQTHQFVVSSSFRFQAPSNNRQSGLAKRPQLRWLVRNLIS